VRAFYIEENPRQTAQTNRTNILTHQEQQRRLGKKTFSIIHHVILIHNNISCPQ
jgi:hypothetical protein